MTRDPISVSELNKQVQSHLDKSFKNIWIQGEISGMKRQMSGHIYCTLKDSIGQLSAVIFIRDAMKLSFNPRDGLEVLAFGSANLYEVKGTFQFIISTMLQTGAGALQLAFEQLKQQLALEGLFDKSRKQLMPVFIQTVVFITSPTGAVIQDFVSILKRHCWKGRLILMPAKVQGESASESLIVQVKRVSQLLMPVDLVVIGRGGGSLEDLQAFNNESLVRALADCPIPIISAVGHEIDYTLCDFVADMRAETPSTAAEFIAKNYLNCLQEYQLMKTALYAYTANSLGQLMQELKQYMHLLKPRLLEQTLRYSTLNFYELQARFETVIVNQLDQVQKQMTVHTNRWIRLLNIDWITFYKQKLLHIQQIYLQLLEFSFRSLAKELEHLGIRLQNCSSEAILNRGYALIEDSSSQEASYITTAYTKALNFNIIFKDGTLKAFVK